MGLSGPANHEDAGDLPSKAQLGGHLREGTLLTGAVSLHCFTFPVQYPKAL